MEKRGRIIEAIATLVGITIGAGILGIPYVIAQSGLILGLLEIFLLGLVILLLNLYVGEISLRTEGKHQLIGYAERYLGKNGKRLMALSLFIGGFGSIVAYILGEGEVLNALFGINPMIAMLIFFIPVMVIIYLGLDFVGIAEIYLSLGFLALLAAIVLLSAININPANIPMANLKNIFVPYGVILFAFLGEAAIPEMREELKKYKKNLKKAIFIGTGLPFLAYFLFALTVVGVTGADATEVATIGLGNFIGPHMVIIGNLFSVLTLATSCLALTLAMKWAFNYDYRMKHFFAWSLTCFVPLAIALSGLTDFIGVLSIAGAIAGGLDGILIVLIHRKAKRHGQRKPEYSIKSRLLLDLLIILIFVGGIAYTLWSL